MLLNDWVAGRRFGHACRFPLDCLCDGTQTGFYRVDKWTNVEIPEWPLIWWKAMIGSEVFGWGQLDHLAVLVPLPGPCAHVSTCLLICLLTCLPM